MARPQPTSDPYRVLGILRGATPAQIKAAHRRLAKRFHPDRSTGGAKEHQEQGWQVGHGTATARLDGRCFSVGCAWETVLRSWQVLHAVSIVLFPFMLSI